MYIYIYYKPKSVVNDVSIGLARRAYFSTYMYIYIYIYMREILATKQQMWECCSILPGLMFLTPPLYEGKTTFLFAFVDFSTCFASMLSPQAYVGKYIDI